MASAAATSPRYDLGPALCLSGGGFRATLFHLGALTRLNQLGTLSKIEIVTSVSGGSILNGVLATRWNRLQRTNDGVFTNFEDIIAKPIRTFCAHDLRTKLLVLARCSPFNWGLIARELFSVPASLLAGEYEMLMERKLLSDVDSPGSGIPRFVFCATNVRTGACWQFHTGNNGRMGDFYSGYWNVGSTRVSDAVAASSAFPPGFAGLRMQLDGATHSRTDPWDRKRPTSQKRAQLGATHINRPILTDGGVYDNLAVEPVWSRCQTLIVSDAGRPFASSTTSQQWLYPRLRRATEISAEQVGAVRKRWLLEQLSDPTNPRTGALWSINSRLEDFPSRADGYDAEVRAYFPEVRTDLNTFSEGEMSCLENHGYALADAAMRSYARAFCHNVAAPYQSPHPNWNDSACAQRALKKSKSRTIVRDIWRAIWQ